MRSFIICVLLLTLLEGGNGLDMQDAEEMQSAYRYQVGRDLLEYIAIGENNIKMDLRCVG
jgi:hypothetical protein